MTEGRHHTVDIAARPPAFPGSPDGTSVPERPAIRYRRPAIPVEAIPLTPLFDATGEQGAARGGIGPELSALYGGDLFVPLRPERPTVIANFVQTIDGVVAFDSDGVTGGGDVSGFNASDRFVMGLLRALTDVVIVGAGTARATGGSAWTPASVHPAAADAYRSLRLRLGLAAEPTALILTATGNLDPGHPAFRRPDLPVVVAAPAPTAEVLRSRFSRLAPHVRVESLGPDAGSSPADAVRLAARLGARVVLTEGGPHLLASFLGARLVDDLFLTVAPQLAGRGRDDPRLSLVEGASLWPAAWTRLVSARRAESHLFLRYRFSGE